MKRIRTGSILGLAAMLLFVAAGTSRAADQVPRQWSEMPLDDIELAPFDIRGSCRADEHLVPFYTSCTLDVALTAGGTELGFTLDLFWMESAPQAECERRLKGCLGPREFPENYLVRSTGRVAFARVGRGICYLPTESACEEQKERLSDELASRRGVVLDMLHDAVSRIELYAIPCRCGDTPIGVQAPELVGRPRPPDPGRRREQVIESVPPRVRVVDPGGDPLGQSNEAGRGDEAPCIEGMPDCPGSRAMRRTGGFPPGVEVVALRFFPSRGPLIPKEERAYDERFSRSIEYLNVELNLAYPERNERFPFEMDVAVASGGEPYANFSQAGMSLEPGWIESYHSAVYGQQGGGFWWPGRYQVEISVEGAVVATGSFEIMASPD